MFAYTYAAVASFSFFFQLTLFNTNRPKKKKKKQKKTTTYNEKYLQYNATAQHLSTTYLVIVTVLTFQQTFSPPPILCIWYYLGTINPFHKFYNNLLDFYRALKEKKKNADNFTLLTQCSFNNIDCKSNFVEY